jgi:hypothetical protein
MDMHLQMGLGGQLHTPDRYRFGTCSGCGARMKEKCPLYWELSHILMTASQYPSHYTGRDVPDVKQNDHSNSRTKLVLLGLGRKSAEGLMDANHWV